MNRGQLRREVRRLLNESSDELWTDSAINDWLNEGVRTMVSIAQPLHTILQITPALRSGSATEYASEYVLPADVDNVEGVYLFNGMTRPLRLVKEEVVHTGTRISGVPSLCYIREMTGQTVQNIGIGPGLQVDNVNADASIKRMVLGVWPAPTSTDQVITLSYMGAAIDMTDDADIPYSIKLEFQRGLVNYAASLAKEMEEAYAEADRLMKKFSEYCQAYKEKMISRGQEMELPRVRERFEPVDSRFHVHWATDD